MKYSLTHCYTDKNKGDAAIIIATIQLIKSIDKVAEISLFSTYGLNDDRLNSDHNTIKKYANHLYPALFPEPIIFYFGRRLQFLRIIPFIWGFLQSMLLLVSKNDSFIKFLLGKEEKIAFKAFISSDVIFSKGGSYLYTENNSIRSSLGLIRMLYPFILASRYNKKMVIFSQSLGPVIGSFNNWMFKYVLQKVDHIYLRESLCIDAYQSVKYLCDKKGYEVIPDTAFYLKSSDSYSDIKIKIDTGLFNVGYTIVDNDYKYVDSDIEYATKRNNYKNSIIDSMKYLIDQEAAIIHIFPQVLVDMGHKGQNDMILSKEIEDNFIGTKYENNIYFYNMDLTPMELRHLYEKMEIFIGTRLHSVIFALSVFVPSINISYHGTKSQGILKQLDGYDEYVIDINIIEPKEFIKKIQMLLDHRKEIKLDLKEKINILNTRLEIAMNKILGN